MIEKLVIQKLTIAGKKYEYPDTTALVGKINEVIDVVNALVYEHDKDSDWYDDPKNREPVDIGELAFLSKENGDLKDEIDRLETELERTRKALGVAIRGLDQMTWGCDSTDAEHLLKEIKEITALEQKG